MSTDEDLRRRREQLVLHHMEVEEWGDAQAVVDSFSVQRYDLAAAGQLLEGPEAVAKRVVDLAAANPGVRIEAVSLRHADDAVIVETRTRGLHQTDLFGMAPTANRTTCAG
ncbi:MAG: hypothetical protein ABW203_03305 [Novosphingobium sp.]